MRAFVRGEISVSHGLVADVDAVAGLVDLRLAVERKVVGVFGEPDAYEQPSGGVGVVDNPFGCGATTGGSERSVRRLTQVSCLTV